MNSKYLPSIKSDEMKFGLCLAGIFGAVYTVNNAIKYKAKIKIEIPKIFSLSVN